MKTILRHFAILFSAVALTTAASISTTFAQDSSRALIWNEATLFAISRDFARPTVHARNLFHTSIAMYDAWAAYDPAAEPYLLGRTRGAYSSAFNGVAIPNTPAEVEAARETAISFAAYRLLRHRFQNSPNAFATIQHFNAIMDGLGLDRNNLSTDYVNGGPAELGNYIAQQVINFGFTDGSNESGGYGNLIYEPVNPNILPEVAGTSGIVDPNRWQAVSLSVAIDQSGNVVSDAPFLSPEWGEVFPFSLTDEHKTVLERDGHEWNVFFDPGTPPLLDTTSADGFESLYKWNFCLVPIWQSHLDPADDTMIDISPASIGGITEYPLTQEDYPDFYDLTEGGVVGSDGYELNPVTGQPYAPQIVRRGDYGRVLAEYWADGPNSVTPPGHWFDIYNHIRFHPLWENKWQGEGPELGNLEFDIKTYLTLGGAMHDAAITAWSIKGYYDYIRPVSAVRYMCEMGQCTDPMAPNFHPAGMPLMPGYIEQIQVGDPLAGANNEHVGEIKLYTWKGPEFIADPETDLAGVGWIRGIEWWPYQRPSFVTPPFAGFISGHSTYSRTAAEVLTQITGTPYFPGGMSNFVAPENEFLEFELGPSETIILQWATYQDASDECSLSRIWGGIHPPADDIPGRHIGMQLGPHAFNTADSIMHIQRPIVTAVEVTDAEININDITTEFELTITFDMPMNTLITPGVIFIGDNPLNTAVSVSEVGWISDTEYHIAYEVLDFETEMPDIFLRITGARSTGDVVQNVHLEARPFSIDTKRPDVLAVTPSEALINDAVTAEDFVCAIQFSEACDTETTPTVSLLSAEDLSGALVYNAGASGWVSDSLFHAVYTTADNNIEVEGIAFEISGATDLSGNSMNTLTTPGLVDIDTRNPIMVANNTSATLLNISTVGSQAVSISTTFDEGMDTSENPALIFPGDNPTGDVLVLNTSMTGWSDAFTYTVVYNQITSNVELDNIHIDFSNFKDPAGNSPVSPLLNNVFQVDTKRPVVDAIDPSSALIADAQAGEGIFHADITFQEMMNTDQLALIQLSGAPDLSQSISYNPFQSEWTDNSTFSAAFNLTDQNVEIDQIDIEVLFAQDAAGNSQTTFELENWAAIDTRNPGISALLANTYNITGAQIGTAGFSILALFDEEMDVETNPAFTFQADGPVDEVLTFNAGLSGWQNGFTYQAHFDVAPVIATISGVEVTVDQAFDMAGNDVNPSVYNAFFDIEILVVGTSQEEAAELMRIYPNPLRAGMPLQVELFVGIQNARFTMYSETGAQVIDKQYNQLNPGMLELSTGSLASGVYFGLLESDHHRTGFKLVVAD